MPSNFTFRDLIVYLTAGFCFVFLLFLVYWSDLKYAFSIFKEDVSIIKDFSSLFTFLIIPIIYVIGHLVNGVDYFFMKYHVWVHKKLSKFRKYWLLKNILMLNEVIFYRHRIVYQYVMFTKKKEENKTLFKGIDDFWGFCNTLKNDNKFSTAEYYYVINDMLKAIYMMLVIFGICAIIKTHYSLGTSMVLISPLAYWRAKQYSDFFIKNVVYLKQMEK
jgi:hypothetical protein